MYCDLPVSKNSDLNGYINTLTPENCENQNFPVEDMQLRAFDLIEKWEKEEFRAKRHVTDVFKPIRKRCSSFCFI